MASSYLAIRSLFSSSLYRSASLFVTRQLGALGVTTIASAQMDQAIPLLLSGLVFLRVMYNYALGRPGNIVSIFEMNLALFTPEALSFSRINWFNLIGQPQLLQPSRGFTEVLMTGIFIMAGYITLLFTSRYRETTGELRRRGAEPGEVDEALAHQTLYSAALSLAAASIIAATAFSIPLLRSLLHPLVSSYEYRYVVLGVASALIIVACLAFYLRERSVSWDRGRGTPYTGGESPRSAS